MSAFVSSFFFFFYTSKGALSTTHYSLISKAANALKVSHSKHQFLTLLQQLPVRALYAKGKVRTCSCFACEPFAGLRVHHLCVAPSPHNLKWGGTLAPYSSLRRYTRATSLRALLLPNYKSSSPFVCVSDFSFCSCGFIKFPSLAREAALMRRKLGQQTLSHWIGTNQ